MAKKSIGEQLLNDISEILRSSAPKGSSLRRRKPAKETFEFEFTDHSGHESDRGGEILSFEFIVSGKKLLARISDTTGDDYVPKQFGLHEEALKVLNTRLDTLKSEAKELEEFLKHAASTTRLSLLDDNFEG